LSANRPFYAFDLLGFGRSSRPPFSLDPIVAEAQFVESIEDWRKEMGLKEFILLGHSFGGYLATSYSLKYPDYVKSLILADPWGFPEHSDEEKPDTPVPLWISLIVNASRFVSPMSIFRASGQLGVSLFKLLRPDFRKKFMTILDDPEIVYSYLYHANNYHPSGEAGFQSIARYFGFAKNPMIRRIDKVKAGMPIWFIYGSRSWIDCTAGYSAVYLRQSIYENNVMSVEVRFGANHGLMGDA
jgi:pimeloyl-ACP methyl ester carboxylesterase